MRELKTIPELTDHLENIEYNYIEAANYSGKRSYDDDLAAFRVAVHLMKKHGEQYLYKKEEIPERCPICAYGELEETLVRETSNNETPYRDFKTYRYECIDCEFTWLEYYEKTDEGEPEDKGFIKWEPILPYYLEEKNMNEDIEKVKKNLMDRGFTVTEALPYGFDFSVYEGEPEKTHSKYLVHVLRPHDDLTWLETVRMSRCVHTTNKSILLAIPTRKSVWYIEIKPSWSEVNH